MSNTHDPWRGIFVIIVTPFKPNCELDEAGLRNVVRFCIEAGAHGLVGPANASEFSTLSDDERRRWIEIVAHENANQLPFVASVTSGHALPAIELSQFAQRVGAHGVMSMPPHVIKPDAMGCYAYYEQLANALDMPVMVQNYIGPVGTPMSVQLLARMCRELPGVSYIKEETFPPSRMVGATMAAAGEHCKGVFGGIAGQYFLDEYRRGAAGTMPACQTTDLMVQVWQQLQAQDEAGARATFNRILPLISYERQYGVGLYKELMWRRGVIEHRTCRAPGSDLDKDDQAELDAILADIAPLYRWHA